MIIRYRKEIFYFSELFLVTHGAFRLPFTALLLKNYKNGQMFLGFSQPTVNTKNFFLVKINQENIIVENLFAAFLIFVVILDKNVKK